MKKRIPILVALLVLLAVVSATAVLAYTYRATYTISENGTASYDMLPVWEASNNQWMIDNGFIIDADALDTRIETLGGLIKPHLITDNMTLTAVPVPSNSQTNLYFTTGNSLLSAFDIIVGGDGYITTADNDTIELGDNFTVEQSGWFDTTLADPGTDVLHFDGSASAASNVNCGAIYDAAPKLWISFWFRLDAPWGPGSGNQYIWGKFIDGANQITVSLLNGGAIQLNKAPGFTILTAETTWTADTWHHVIASISSTAGARLRVNNVAAVTNVDVTAAPNGGDFVMGDFDDPGAGNSGFVGEICNFVAGTDDLSDGEETAFYYYGIAPGDETDYWSIDEGSGTNIVSYGSAGNDGTADTDVSWETSARPIIERPFAFKSGAFQSLTHITSGNITSVCGGSSVNATGFESDEYTIATTANVTHLSLEIDGTVRDITLLSANVTNNTNSWVWMGGNSIPYADNITISVNGTERLRYKPATYILGDNLPDLTGTSQNGTITWGTNPTGVTVSLGSMVSSFQPAPGEGVSRPAQDILPEVEVSDWFTPPDVSGTLLTNPMRPFVIILSDNSTLTEIQSWRLLGLALILLVTVSTGRAVRGHHFITGVACGASLGGMVALTVFPMWALVFMILPLFAGLIAERSPSL